MGVFLVLMQMKRKNESSSRVSGWPSSPRGP